MDEDQGVVASLRRIAIAAPCSGSPIMPYWVTRTHSTNEQIVATFQPCSCKRGTPLKFVHQEKVRWGPGGKGRTLSEATKMLIEKVHRFLLHVIVCSLARLHVHQIFFQVKSHEDNDGCNKRSIVSQAQAPALSLSAARDILTQAFATAETIQPPLPRAQRSQHSSGGKRSTMVAELPSPPRVTKAGKAAASATFNKVAKTLIGSLRPALVDEFQRMESGRHSAVLALAEERGLVGELRLGRTSERRSRASLEGARTRGRLLEEAEFDPRDQTSFPDTPTGQRPSAPCLRKAVPCRGHGGQEA